MAVAVLRFGVNETERGKWNRGCVKEMRELSPRAVLAQLGGKAGRGMAGTGDDREDGTRWATANGARCGLRGLEEKAEARAPNA